MDTEALNLRFDYQLRSNPLSSDSKVALFNRTCLLEPTICLLIILWRQQFAFRTILPTIVAQ